MMSLRIALITDIHHGADSAYVRGRVTWPLLEDALAQIVRRSPDLLVDLGDRINEEEAEVARAAMRDVAAAFRPPPFPRVHLLGNHDTVPRLEQETPLGVTLGNRSLEIGGWQLVFLDTFVGSVEGALSEETLAWLEHTLAATRLPPGVFSHQPLDGQPLPGNPFFGGEFFYQAHPRGHEAVRRILEDPGKVHLAVSGYSHWNHFVRVGGIPCVTVDALVPLAQERADAGVSGFLTLDEGKVVLETLERSPWRLALGRSAA